MARAPHFLTPLLKSDSDGYAFHIEGRDAVLATTIEPAFDSASRRKGLLGRTGLPAGAAIVIAPCNAIHTWFMKFPIDVVFAAKDGRVTRVHHAVKSWRLASSFFAFAAIEMAAGEAARVDLKRGDRLVLERAGTKARSHEVGKTKIQT